MGVKNRLGTLASRFPLTSSLHSPAPALITASLRLVSGIYVFDPSASRKGVECAAATVSWSFAEAIYHMSIRRVKLPSSKDSTFCVRPMAVSFHPPFVSMRRPDGHNGEQKRRGYTRAGEGTVERMLTGDGRADGPTTWFSHQHSPSPTSKTARRCSPPSEAAGEEGGCEGPDVRT